MSLGQAVGQSQAWKGEGFTHSIKCRVLDIGLDMVLEGWVYSGTEGSYGCDDGHDHDHDLVAP
jgi:hypothetical protein